MNSDKQNNFLNTVIFEGKALKKKHLTVIDNKPLASVTVCQLMTDFKIKHVTSGISQI